MIIGLSHALESIDSLSLSRQSAQSTVHTAIPGDPVSYGENTHMVPRYLSAMGKILKWYPDTLLAMGKLLRGYPDTC